MNDPVTVYLSLQRAGIFPTKAHDSDAGWDLYISRIVRIAPGEAADVHTDVYFALPPGWFANIKPRSSTFIRHGIHIIEGIVDAGYRGELFIQAVNPDPFKWVNLHPGERIAQVLFLPVPRVKWVQTEHLPVSERGDTGFGMSGR